MKIYAISVATQAKICDAYDLGDFSFFQRYTIINFIEFLSKELRKKAKQEEIAHKLDQIEHQLDTKQIRIYNYHLPDKSIIVYVDAEYPHSAVMVLLKIIKDLEEDKIQSEIDKFIVEYQDPAKLDKLIKIKEDLDATIATVHKTIEQVLDRGKKLDDLVRESEVLSESSKLFYQEAKKNNRCCTIS